MPSTHNAVNMYGRNQVTERLGYLKHFRRFVSPLKSKTSSETSFGDRSSHCPTPRQLPGLQLLVMELPPLGYRDIPAVLRDRAFTREPEALAFKIRRQSFRSMIRLLGNRRYVSRPSLAAPLGTHGQPASSIRPRSKSSR